MQTGDEVKYSEILLCMICLDGSDIEEVNTILCPSEKGCVIHVHDTCLEDWYDHYPGDPSCPLCRSKTSADNVDSDVETADTRILPPRISRRRVRCSTEQTKCVITWCISSGIGLVGGILFTYLFFLKS